jgi:hypothetical protein
MASRCLPLLHQLRTILMFRRRVLVMVIIPSCPANPTKKKKKEKKRRKQDITHRRRGKNCKKKILESRSTGILPTLLDDGEDLLVGWIASGLVPACRGRLWLRGHERAHVYAAGQRLGSQRRNGNGSRSSSRSRRLLNLARIAGRRMTDLAVEKRAPLAGACVTESMLASFLFPLFPPFALVRWEIWPTGTGATTVREEGARASAAAGATAGAAAGATAGAAFGGVRRPRVGAGTAALVVCPPAGAAALVVWPPAGGDRRFGLTTVVSTTAEAARPTGSGRMVVSRGWDCGSGTAAATGCFRSGTGATTALGSA